MKLILLFCISLLLYGCKSELPKEQIQVTKQPETKHSAETSAMYYKGNISVKKEYFIKAPVTGLIKKICSDGAFVDKGDFLIEFDTLQLEQDLTTAKFNEQQSILNLEMAKTNLETLQTSNELDIKTKKAQLTNDKIEMQISSDFFLKQKRLYDEHLVKIKDLEFAESDLNAKRVKVENDETELEKTEKENGLNLAQKKAEILLKQMEVEKAKLDVKKAQQMLSKATVRSPFKGVVNTLETYKELSFLPFTAGDNVFAGRLIMTIGDLSALKIDINISEYNIAKVKKGQKVLIETEATPGKFTTGTVTEILTITEPEQWDYTLLPHVVPTAVYLVTIDINNNLDNILRPDMNCSIKFSEEPINVP